MFGEARQPPGFFILRTIVRNYPHGSADKEKVMDNPILRIYSLVGGGGGWARLESLTVSTIALRAFLASSRKPPGSSPTRPLAQFPAASQVVKT